MKSCEDPSNSGEWTARVGQRLVYHRNTVAVD